MSYEYCASSKERRIFGSRAMTALGVSIIADALHYFAAQFLVAQ